MLDGQSFNSRVKKFKLDQGRPLDYQRAIVIEYGNTVCGYDKIGVLKICDPADKVHYGLLGYTLLPGRQWIINTAVETPACRDHAQKTTVADAAQARLNPHSGQAPL
jgi:hypothetical protein